VGGTGTVNGITLTGTVTSTGNLTLGGALSGVNLATQVTGTLPVANGGTGVTTSTGTGAVVLSNSPTLVTPVLGTPSSATLTNATGLPIDGGTTGTLPVSRGGTGATTLTANNVLLGNGTSALQVVAPGTSGNVLTSNGTTWTSAAAGASLIGVTESTSPFETSLGFEAGLNTTGNNATFVGYRAGKANIGGTDNTAVGWSTLASNTTGISNTSIGRSASAVTTTGSYNSAFGVTAGSGTTGNLNCSFGWNSHNQGTTSYENSAFGARSLQQITTGFRNTAVGYAAMQFTDTGNSNVAVGLSSGAGITSGTQNTVVGANAAYTGTNNLDNGSNNTLIGYNAEATSSSVSNEITLGNSSIATLRCQVTSITSLSDARDKTDVAPLNDGLKLVNALSPVRFTWNTRDGAKVGVPDMGFIAQELKAAQEQTGIAVPNLVYESNPDRMEAAYSTLIPVLVKAIQELSAEVAALKAKV
jgi:hypothetical protein